MTRKKRVLSSLEIEKAAHRDIESKMKKTSWKSGPMVSKNTWTTLDEHLPEIEVLKAKLLEDAQVKNVCNNAIIKWIIAIVIIRIIVYYFNH